jgi:hypothetical protein
MFCFYQVLSLRDLVADVFPCYRKLKHTVNQVLSLRDRLYGFLSRRKGRIKIAKWAKRKQSCYTQYARTVLLILYHYITNNLKRN